MEKNEAIEKIKLGIVNYESLFTSLKNDRDVVLSAVKYERNGFQKIPIEFKDDEEIVLEATLKNPENLKYASDRIRSDFEYAKKLIKIYPQTYQYISHDLIQKLELLLLAIENIKSGCLKVSESLPKEKLFEFLKNQKVLNYVLNNEIRVLEDLASTEIIFDKETAIQVVSKNGKLLGIVSKELRGDKEVAIAAIAEYEKGFYDAFKFVSDQLRGETSFLLEALKYKSYIIDEVSDELKNDRDFIIKACSINGLALQYTLKKFRSDKEILLVAVTEDGLSLEYSSVGWKTNKQIVRVAVTNNGEAIKFGSNNLRNDYDIALAAVKSNGRALIYLSDKLKDDKTIVRNAIQNADVFRYASKRLQNDDELRSIYENKYL